MDKKISAFKEFVVSDALAGIRGITSKAMFGGYGIYKDDYIFAIILDDGDLYFKVGPSNIEDYKSKGSKPFIYERGEHKKTEMPYYRIPDEILEDREEIIKWVDKSVEVTKNAKKSGQ